jgi:hypothetical protein
LDAVDIYVNEQILDDERGFIVWYDNYQVCQAKTSLHLKETLWRNSKMCAVAAIIPPVSKDRVNFRLRTYPDGTVIPATMFPTDEDNKNYIEDIIDIIMEEKTNYYPHSFVVQYEVENVPPKFFGTNDKETKDYEAPTPGGVCNLFPISLMDSNPQSQKGLLEVLHSLYKKFDIKDCKGYKAILMDISLYWSTSKVMLGIPRMKQFRDKTFICFGINLFIISPNVVLGLWHVYPQMYKILWQTWFNEFLGPLWFELFPSTKIWKKLKHHLLEVFFTWLRFSWVFLQDDLPAIVEEFRKRINEHKEGKTDDEKHQIYYDLYCFRILTDLQLMSSIFIAVF